MPARYPNKIYAYTTPQHENLEWEGRRTGIGWLKVGETEQMTVETRIEQQFGVNEPRVHGKPKYTVKFAMEAMREDGTSFSDHDVHRVLEHEIGAKRLRDENNHLTEFFECTVEEVERAYIAVKNRCPVSGARKDFPMRWEQQKAVNETATYFRDHPAVGSSAPHFLWNAKMRFGKTFATYQLAREMKWKRILVLTFKPAAGDQWETDLREHIDFQGWQFVSKDTSLQYDKCDQEQPIVWFASFQDVLGKTSDGKIKAKNQVMGSIEWDGIVLDEYHFGAWRERAQDLFASDETDAAKAAEEGQGLEEYDESKMTLQTGAYLYLSGTPFRALQSGEFLQEQIFNWTYKDEQQAKQNWDNSQGTNPYAALPEMDICLYELPEDLRRVAVTTEYNGFDLSEFFKAKKNPDNDEYVFEHDGEVRAWLDYICAAPPADPRAKVEYLKNLNARKKIRQPFGDMEFEAKLRHTLWFLPSVASCRAMKRMLESQPHFAEYSVVCCAGSDVGNGADARIPVDDAIGQGWRRRSITLSCGKLTTGVTIPEWSGIFMLRNTESPETYFQAAFRVQSKWEQDGSCLKEKCYVFDYAPVRALTEITEYAFRLSGDSLSNPEENITEFINFLPVLAFGVNEMRVLNAYEILKLATQNGADSLLANRWRSAKLVNVTQDAIKRLLADRHVLEVLQRINGLEEKPDKKTMLNDNDAIKKLKKKLKDRDGRQDGEKDKELAAFQKEIQDKLRKINTLLPIFLYLTDKREKDFNDILETEDRQLFAKVLAFRPDILRRILDLGLLQSDKLALGILGFKESEDSSLTYTGINTHSGEEGDE